MSNLHGEFIAPRRLGFEHGIEDRKGLTHARHDRHLGLLPCHLQTLV